MLVGAMTPDYRVPMTGTVDMGHPGTFGRGRFPEPGHAGATAGYVLGYIDPYIGLHQVSDSRLYPLFLGKRP